MLKFTYNALVGEKYSLGTPCGFFNIFLSAYMVTLLISDGLNFKIIRYFCRNNVLAPQTVFDIAYF